MEYRISATEFARKLGDVLGKIRYRGDSFIVERSGEPVARIARFPGHSDETLAAALGAWREAVPPDPAFADDLERVNRADRTPENPWAL